jgi:trinucleotide repeat-containing gene 6 protein
LSGGASGWGSPPSNTSSNNNNNNNNNQNNPNAGQWGATAQQTPQQNWNQAAQQAGGVGPTSSQSQQGQQPNPVAPGQPQQVGQAQKPLTPGGPSGGWNQPQQAQIPNPVQQQVQQIPQQVPGTPGVVGGGTSAVAAKNQLEQLNSMREALFAQDGWSCQNVNQDTNWDVPGSPEPGPRTGEVAGAPVWKSHIVNNGTELWEANLRNGGQPPPQPVQKTPWNHTPTTNIGGTWGEDDDGGENASVWTGNQSQQAPGWNQQGGAGANAGAAGGAAMWPGTTPGKNRVR